MEKRRVVVTGLGVVSSIGGCADDVVTSLRECRSGITICDQYVEYKFRSRVHGYPKVKDGAIESIDRRCSRFMGDAARWSYIAMREAIDDSGLEESDISSCRTGVIAGSGGVSSENMLIGAKTVMSMQGTRKMGPFMVPRTMASSVSANLATIFKIKGHNFSVSSACSSSSHFISVAADIIASGLQDTIFAGGGEDVHWTLSCFFDAMGALSSKFNDDPERASRAFDVSRDGFVIAGGAGILVLEELNHAKARGAKIYAELVGSGANSDGCDMVQPSGEGAVRCMRLALQGLKEGQKVDYVNAHGTSTPIGDLREIESLKSVFSDIQDMPYVSSSKSLAGHSLGAVGAQEAIYSLLMLDRGFVGGAAHITELMPEAKGVPIPLESFDYPEIRTVMSNSFGFGGTNAVLIFSKLED